MKKRVYRNGGKFLPLRLSQVAPFYTEDFEEFCRGMRVKWYFRNESSEYFSSKPAFSPKSTWNSLEGHSNLEVFLSQIENELFKKVETPSGYSIGLWKISDFRLWYAH